MVENSTIAGLSVILQPSTKTSATIPLENWLLNDNPSLVWIPLKPQQGITKAMPVLAKSQEYPQLLQSICLRLAEGAAVEWQGHPYAVGGVELEPGDLHKIQVTLTSEKPLPPTMGRATHALCLKWFQTVDEALAVQLHSSPSTPLTAHLKKLADRRYQLNISILEQSLLSPILWGLSQDLDQQVALTNIGCHLSQQVHFKASTSFKSLIETEPQPLIALKFITPTAFKQGGKKIQPFPLPELVFGSLLRRWNAFAPEELHFPAVEWQGLVSAFDLKTQVLRLEGGPQIGSVGWVRYRFPDPEQARIASVLAQYAFFAGVGLKTTMGMGQVQSWKGNQNRKPTSNTDLDQQESRAFGNQKDELSHEDTPITNN